MTASQSDLAQTDATGTVRRLQALVAAGWPVLYIAAELGMFPTAVSRLMRKRVVTLCTARRVAAVYDRLWAVDPATHGATPKGILRARNLAHAMRWAPAGAWDDDTIDDPAAFPDWTGHCGTTRGIDLHARHSIPLCPPCEAALKRRRLRNQAHALRALSATRA
ncbi:hypothetical protein ACIGMX_16160 [Streptomyces aquilus]|uniref:hypothetical protein n=1 Tax=Streptomyces aquilus TaxID=2548456 RepID=UPI0037D2DF52